MICSVDCDFQFAIGLGVVYVTLMLSYLTDDKHTTCTVIQTILQWRRGITIFQAICAGRENYAVDQL